MFSVVRRVVERGGANEVKRSYSRFMAYEACRILHRLGVDVRVFNPKELPMKDDVSIDHEKVQELRGLSAWSDGHVWCSPEQHGTVVCSPPLPHSCPLLAD